ncbi:MAG: DnaJ domain-containing protein [Deltaproteobacteria bacterium]|nr:DnaJ domain-containing protein [Deltaproteobacteria bacterium]
MFGYYKVLAIILVMLYIMSPYDLLPDFLIPVGWLDDLLILGILVYYLWRGRLPGILSSWGRSSQDTRRSFSWTDSEAQAEFDHKDKTRTKLSNPYEILGVKPGASDEEIRTAYRQAVQLYHPDKVSHLGPELKDVARRKFLEIHEAYEKLRKTSRS